MPRSDQIKIIGKENRAIIEKSKEIRHQISEVRRIERIKNLPSPTLNVEGKYPLIYVDPPWQYDYSKSESRAIENYYPTMELGSICNLPVADIAHEDCILFLWATSPKLHESMKVIDAWGFTYLTCAVWDKEIMGMGYYFRQQHELLLIAMCGNVPAPEPENRPSSIFTERRSKHSSKPEIAYQIIESMYPELAKIELFARSKRDGWEVWGNQA
jgi:N6-adenosine-specific RNA methylase IME4